MYLYTHIYTYTFRQSALAAVCTTPAHQNAMELSMCMRAWVRGRYLCVHGSRPGPLTRVQGFSITLNPTTYFLFPTPYTLHPLPYALRPTPKPEQYPRRHG